MAAQETLNSVRWWRVSLAAVLKNGISCVFCDFLESTKTNSQVERGLMLVSVAESFSEGGLIGDMMAIRALLDEELREIDPCLPVNKCPVTEV